MATQPPPEAEPAPPGAPMTHPPEVSPPQHDVDIPDPAPETFPPPNPD